MNRLQILIVHVMFRKYLKTAEYAQWRSFRESDDARYVALTMPRVLGRLPYDPKEGWSTEGFNFVEEVSG